MALHMQVLVTLNMYLDELREGFKDENERDEKRKDLLGERGDVAYEETALSRHNHQDNEDEPEPDPHSACEIFEALRLAELIMRKNKGAIEKIAEEKERNRMIERQTNINDMKLPIFSRNV